MAYAPTRLAEAIRVKSGSAGGRGAPRLRHAAHGHASRRTLAGIASVLPSFHVRIISRPAEISILSGRSMGKSVGTSGHHEHPSSASQNRQVRVGSTREHPTPNSTAPSITRRAGTRVLRSPPTRGTYACLDRAHNAGYALRARRLSFGCQGRRGTEEVTVSTPE